MSYPGFKAENHPQQTRARGAKDSVDDRATTPELFGEIADELGPFTLDVAASDENAKCPAYYTRADDGLSMPWEGEAVWCNPPFSNIRPWVERAWQEWRRTRVIAMLLPANRTEQGWWQDWVEPYRDAPGSPLSVRFLRGRTRFIKPGDDHVLPNSRPPFGCVLLVWRALGPPTATADLFTAPE